MLVLFFKKIYIYRLHFLSGLQKKKKIIIKIGLLFAMEVFIFSHFLQLKKQLYIVNDMGHIYLPHRHMGLVFIQLLYTH